MLTRHKKSKMRKEELIIKKHWLMNMSLMDDVGLYESVVKGKLRQKYSSPEGKEYIYEDWEILMYVDRYVFEDLCGEFHYTYRFKENPESMEDKEFMKFSLGGVEHSMSLKDFTRCLKIYTQKEMDEKYFFIDYIWKGARVSEMNDIQVFDPEKVWKGFSSSNKSYYGDGKKVSRIDLDAVDYRLIHMYLSLNIFHRSEDTDKVTLSDLWYLQQFKSKTRVNIPYCVAYYLKDYAAGQSPICCGGHFVTLIAHHLGILDDERGGPVGGPPFLRGNPMIKTDDYRDAHIVSLSETLGFTVFEEGLEEKDPIDIYKISADRAVLQLDDDDDDDNDDHGGGGIYESFMSMLEDHQLSKKQLIEIHKKIESQLEMWRSCPDAIKGKKKKKKKMKSKKKNPGMMMMI